MTSSNLAGQPTTRIAMTDTTADNLGRLFTYLTELERDNRKVNRDIRVDHRSFNILGHEIADWPSLQFHQVDGEGAPVWLEVPRLQPHSPPQPEAGLVDWVDVTDNPERPPIYRDSLTLTPVAIPEALAVYLGPIAVEEPDTPTTFYLTNHPDLEAALVAYHAEWEAWAATEAPRRRVVDLYNQFFQAAHTVEEASPEAPMELVWGLGMTAWQPATGHPIRYPLLTQVVDVEIDEVSRAIRLRPRDREPEVEIAPFREQEVPHLATFEREAGAYLAEHRDAINPFQAETYAWPLRKAVATFTGEGYYLPDPEPDALGATESQTPQPDLGFAPVAPTPEPKSRMEVTDDWAIFLRRRSSNFLIKDLQALGEVLAEAEDLGPVPRALVEPPLDEPLVLEPTPYRGLEAGTSLDGTPPEDAQDLHFPLAYNDEQVEVIQSLDQFEGTVVQGPPGTGKTHTIANVICHYLATGRRVLVASEREQALRVIHRYLPEPIRPFAINLLAGDRAGLRELEHAVSKLANDVANLDRRATERAIERAQSRIEERHRRLATINHGLREIADQQLGTVGFFGQTLTPMELADQVVKLRETYGWFPDANDPRTTPPVGTMTMDQVRVDRLTLGDDLVYATATLPDPADLPAPADVRNLHQDLVQAADLQARQQQGEIPPLADRQGPTLSKASALLAELEAHREILADLDAPWKEALRKAYLDYHQGRPTNVPAGNLEGLRQEMEALRSERLVVQEWPTEIPPGWEANSDFREIIRWAAARGRLPWRPLRGRDLREALSAIRVSGDPPQTKKAWRHAARYTEFLHRVRQAVLKWNHLAPEFGAPTIDAEGESGAKALTDLALTVTAIQRLATGFDPYVPAALRELFPRGVDADAVVASAERAKEVAQYLRAHLQEDTLQAGRQRLREHLDLLADYDGEVTGHLRQFLRDTIGDPDWSPQAIETQWGNLVGEVAHLHQLAPTFERLRDATALLVEAGAKNWAHHLLADPAGETDPWVPANWQEAWEWAQADTHLRVIDSRDQLRHLARERLAVEGDLSGDYQELVQNRVLLSVNERLTPHVQAALNRYLNAINGIGAGQGVWAPHYRQMAREAMAEAHRAVPCWIMPNARVSETLPPEPGLFDLVIIDEASQSNAYALPSVVRGSKVLVVGDNKQVSPMNPGLSMATVTYFIERYLEGLPNRYMMGPDTSLYDLAKVLFPKRPIMLREHFRCAEPIIQFSNQLSYHGEIRPLRVPTPSERIDPPLVDILVTDGYRDGRKKRNPPEVEVIVAEIKRLLDDPRLRHRSIGVVSLLERDQANTIYNRLMAELGPEVLEDHDIRCGDASAFQGSEADIVFLSMVDDDRWNALSRQDWRQQRYNVAVSRARDRLYLVRSIHRNALQAADLRARLIDHFANPVVGRRGEMAANPRDLCQSGFERDVYDELVARGYRVTPQVPAGGFFIDLVVEDDNDNRLAIELDGDLAHPPEQWQDDQRRQRVLERIGWTFWRCWGSAYQLAKDDCLDDLEAALAAQGLEPAGVSGDVTPNRSLVEHREVASRREAASEEAPAEEPTGPEPVEGEVAEDENDTAPEGTPETGATEGAESSNKESSQASLELETPEPAGRTMPGGLPRVVEIGDRVTYRLIDEAETGEPTTVQISRRTSDPDTGVVNYQTPWAQAFIDAEEGEEVTVALQASKVHARIEEVEGSGE